ncbi:16S rRNA (cytidine(1402)-2'-O)-methyltransferase [Nesterenkonia sphaerica]|uniref:16S rRNA (cytidine(1402)-2'-O)-methyltransferase n=1 Tax=Nesterenkonia sphaerica TaxID=1804988 RepID=UPI001AA04794|nr:16S rRNA (cytidine(1402)-2'-O)-methyltransferase [Nesterenkonia sphaerica]
MLEPSEEWLWEAPVVLAATPIGNLADATERLRLLIRSADVIACEDTRSTRHLISALGERTDARLVSLHEHNEAARSAELVGQAREGTRVLVVSDAGMPAVSDPGRRLVSAAIAADLPVTAAPGASAVPTALALSGLATDRFTFAGFVPRKQAERRALLKRLQREEWTTVLFESPHRIASTVTEFSEALGPTRRAAVARELTKKYEEVLRGELGELAELLTERHRERGIRGEIVLVIDHAADDAEPSLTLEQAASAVVQSAAGGERLKDASKRVARENRLHASDLYDAANRLRGGSG